MWPIFSHPGTSARFCFTPTRRSRASGTAPRPAQGHIWPRLRMQRTLNAGVACMCDNCSPPLHSNSFSPSVSLGTSKPAAKKKEASQPEAALRERSSYQAVQRLRLSILIKVCARFCVRASVCVSVLLAIFCLLFCFRVNN